MDNSEHDVIVVGAGNAALYAALSAREHGASVVVLECAPETEAGGNSRFAGGVTRFAFDGVDALVVYHPIPGYRLANRTTGRGQGSAKATTWSPRLVSKSACPPAAMTTNCLPLRDQ